jgi:hypothetical protein
VFEVSVVDALVEVSVVEASVQRFKSSKKALNSSK